MTYEVCIEQRSSGDFYDAMESRLMKMTFWAHKAVLFDKIKQKIEEKEGAKLEKIADLVVDNAIAKWKSDQESEKKQEEAEKKHDELREKIKDTFEE